MGQVGKAALGFAFGVAALAPASNAQEGNAQNDANNPLTPKVTINLQDYYIPSFKGLPGRDANQFLLRGLIPLNLFDTPQLLRFTLPIANSPTLPTGSDPGFGDLTLIDLVLIPGKPVSFGVGPVLVAPTASTDALGTGRWQTGAAAVAIAPQSWGLLGGLVIYQHSFAKDDGRDPVNLLTVQPIVNVNLPEGFYLRSSAIWNFDLEHDTRYIPVGLGLGKVFQVGKTTVNAFIEPQYTVWRNGDGVPRWQIFGGLNFQFSIN
ncbi:hypothetical protein [Microvirga subterranea]|uniref:Outer membrane beta-barrel porin/alpha-amylase n=1 Tax=Microvirga subterranea TaxID=186651 RepID=A0A370HHI0_9HYPH|nr:hypothetical protein [Microvirga subterranea]RDI57179.1 hypothetical protein DES45_10796 [Microvirga subterranea]